MPVRDLAVVVALGTAGGVPVAAGAASDVEGVWEFNGGQVAVAPQGGGKFQGTVLVTTKLRDCNHEVGEQMWADMTLQPDGQYFGKHWWFRPAPGCGHSGRGNTAFRVLTDASGRRTLRVCFEPPETPTLQPTIAPDGVATTFQVCHDSNFLTPVATSAPSFASTVTLPKQGKRRCLSKRAFKIHLREPKGDRLASATVYVNGKRKLAITNGARLTSGISLRGLPKGRYVVKIVARTVLGRTIKGTRTYHTCVTRKKSKHKIKI